MVFRFKSSRKYPPVIWRIQENLLKDASESERFSKYKVVKVEVFGGEDFEFPQQAEQWNGQDFITKIILEDKKGALFSVKPDYSGLRFAKGEITYKEYNKIQKKRMEKELFIYRALSLLLC